jgi:hypothetical protein
MPPAPMLMALAFQLADGQWRNGARRVSRAMTLEERGVAAYRHVDLERLRVALVVITVLFFIVFVFFVFLGFTIFMVVPAIGSPS